jgi:hypothetical protein
LNFIFSRKLLEGWKGDGLTDGIINDIYDVEILSTSKETRELLSQCSTLGEKAYEEFCQDFDSLVTDLKGKGMEVGSELFIAQKMISNWTRHEMLWHKDECNEATYLSHFIFPILDALFRGAGLVDVR